MGRGGRRTGYQVGVELPINHNSEERQRLDAQTHRGEQQTVLRTSSTLPSVHRCASVRLAVAGSIHFGTVSSIPRMKYFCATTNKIRSGNTAAVAAAI